MMTCRRRRAHAGPSGIMCIFAPHRLFYMQGALSKMKQKIIFYAESQHCLYLNSNIRFDQCHS